MIVSSLLKIISLLSFVERYSCFTTAPSNLLFHEASFYNRDVINNIRRRTTSGKSETLSSRIVLFAETPKKKKATTKKAKKKATKKKKKSTTATAAAKKTRKTTTTKKKKSTKTTTKTTKKKTNVEEDVVVTPELVSSDDEGSSSSTSGDFIDPSELGIYSEKDYEAKHPLEWDYDGPDPNIPSDAYEYVSEKQHDEEGVEIGWDPIFGPSNPIDERTIVTQMDSYMIDDKTKDETMLTPLFPDPNDPEIEFNDEVKNIRKDLKIVETYTDEYLNVEVPRNVAKWYGYPQELSYPKKDFMNNRYTKPEDKTDFTKLTPFRARKKAVELARSTTNEWLPEGKSYEYHKSKQEIYKLKGIKVGSLEKGEMDATITAKIAPVLRVLGGVAELLEIYGEDLTVFRFHYYGPLKNKRGMAAWTETMIRDVGVECTGVVFETGGRLRDRTCLDRQ
eukprot:CAMPEP_0178956690 /NCGR_PEP_ID=MMETSP0789-20121207/10433_1 /TAXON_ID=3005 /ORGANISM="Rhizosolenia setigera, Strain CCMP 1694" /LENGTH=448 /DNA_ID=CAMNT_0020638725 /DNA_START=91 /DNA_END=1437 /DNA_ORIENTATION=-